MGAWTDKYIDMNTDGQKNRLVDRLTDMHTDRQIDR